MSKNTKEDIIFLTTPKLLLSQEDTMNSVAKHQLYQESLSEEKYVTRGSKVICSGGTKSSKLDLRIDHGITNGEEESILTCLDYDTNENLHSFGTCSLQCDSPSCEPAVSQPWEAFGARPTTFAWVEEKNTYGRLLTEDSYLTCARGGYITVEEVPEAALLSIHAASPIDVKNAWYLEMNKKWRYYKSGYYLINRWIYYNNNWYYVDGNGYLVVGWLESKNLWYYLESELDGNQIERHGHMARGWMQIGEKQPGGDKPWYYFISLQRKTREMIDSSDQTVGWYIDDTAENRDEMEVAGHMVTGWCKINGKWYFFENNGKMVSSKLVLHTDGKYYFLQADGSMAEYNQITDPATGTVYYADENGVCTKGMPEKGAWILEDDNKWRYYRSNNYLVSQWVYHNDNWYYVDKEGYLVTGWFQSKGKWYYLDSNIDENGIERTGHMIIGWLQTGEGQPWYYFISVKNGEGIEQAGEMAIGWHKIDGKWYYFEDDGKMVSSRLLLHTDGNYYFLQADGAMAVSKQITDPETGIVYDADENGVCKEVVMGTDMEKWMQAVKEISLWYVQNVPTYQKQTPDKGKGSGSRKYYSCGLITPTVGDDCSSHVAACLVRFGILSETTYYSQQYNKNKSDYSEKLGVALKGAGFVWYDYDENHIPARGDIQVQHNGCHHVEVIDDYDTQSGNTLIWSWGKVYNSLPVSRNNWKSRISGYWRMSGGSTGQIAGTPEIEQMLQNINSDKSLSLSLAKKETLVGVGRILLNEGYEPAFVAGILGNIIHEGTAGYFENSKYVSKPDEKPQYLRYMDNNYSYSTKYSGQYITAKSLSELGSLLAKLETFNWEQGKFGLGCIQWTGSRTKDIFNEYRSYSGGSDQIGMNQVIEAEAELIIEELNSNTYSHVHQEWKDSNSSRLETAEAAYSAGKDWCIKFEKPKDAATKAPTRANTSKKLYNTMVSN